MSLELILGAVLAAILGGFGIYWKGRSAGTKQAETKAELQKKAEDAMQLEIRVDTMKATKNAQAEVDSMPAGAAGDRLFDEFNRDR